MVPDMKRTYALTGAGGFLGWHVKLALHANGCDFLEIPLGERFDIDQAACAIGKADDLIHLAGVNRGADEEIAEGNRLFAEQVCRAATLAGRSLSSITYANSSQSRFDSVYGTAKLAAGETLARTAEQLDSEYRDIVLPNLFGEHGLPFYNSVVATFCHLLATGEDAPSIQIDRELTLLHAQDAADWIIGSIEQPREDSSLIRRATVSELLIQLEGISKTYRRHEFPDLSDSFTRDLFNTYRSYLPIDGIPLHEHTDQRGSFIELARCWGGTGQASFSTTLPGVSRGNHYHRRKVERFAVLAGKANLELRRMFTEPVITIAAHGGPIVVDQPTGWTHNLKNTDAQTLYTFFWTNDIFDPDNPDTFPEPV